MFKKWKERKRLKRNLESYQKITFSLYEMTKILLTSIDELNVNETQIYKYSEISKLTEMIQHYSNTLQMYANNPFFSSTEIFIITNVQGFLNKVFPAIDKASREMDHVLSIMSFINKHADEDSEHDMTDFEQKLMSLSIDIRHAMLETRACIENVYGLIARDTFKFIFDVDMISEYYRRRTPTKYNVEFSNEYKVSATTNHM